MRLSLEAREKPARIMVWASPLLAAVGSVIGVSILFAVLGRPPLQALYVLFIAPLFVVAERITERLARKKKKK